jgi:hypothetical protein
VLPLITQRGATARPRFQGWTRFKAAQEWLDRNAQDPEVRAKFKDFMKQEGLAGKLPTAGQALFQEFLDWSGKQPK